MTTPMPDQTPAPRLDRAYLDELFEAHTRDWAEEVADFDAYRDLTTSEDEALTEDFRFLNQVLYVVEAMGARPVIENKLSRWFQPRMSISYETLVPFLEGADIGFYDGATGLVTTMEFHYSDLTTNPDARGVEAAYAIAEALEAAYAKTYAALEKK